MPSGAKGFLWRRVSVESRIGRSISKILQKILVAVVVLAGVTYAGDYLQLRYRVWRNAGPFGTVQVERYYAVHEKNNKVEFMFPHETQNQDCVHSLFPHMGYSPCWYLNRNREQRIDI